MRVANWETDFPRLSDLYRSSDVKNLSNHFLQDNVISALSRSSPAAVEFEKELQKLSAIAWTEFKPKALMYVCVTQKRRGRNQLFECFNEVKGYISLSSKYDDIRFIKEISTKTPDLIASSKTSSALMEVKTINESEQELDYLGTPLDNRDALKGEHTLSESLKKKVSIKISEAKKQLLRYTARTVHERIIFLVIRLDFQCATSDTTHDLDSFLKGQSGNGIKIECQILN
jgi:hypothetical protein